MRYGGLSGCLAGFLKLAVLDAVFDWLQNALVLAVAALVLGWAAVLCC